MADDKSTKWIAAGVLSLIAFGTMPLSAETLKTEPEAVIDQIVEDATMNDDGIMEPSTGAATPTENWFGCEPSGEDSAGACEPDDADEAEASK